MKSIVNQAIKPVKTEMTVIKTIALDNKTKVKNMKTDVKVKNRKVPNQFFTWFFDIAEPEYKSNFWSQKNYYT